VLNWKVQLELQMVLHVVLWICTKICEYRWPS